MKKILIAILVAVLSVSFAFALTSCKAPEETKVTITYDADGGQISQTTQEVDVNDFTLLIPTKAGYTFTGWTLNGEAFTEDNILRNDVTLVATWQINTFSVTFEVGDRGTLVGEKTQTLNAVGFALPTVNAKPGAEFIGWTLNGQEFTLSSVLTANSTLVATYNVTGYTVSYVYNGTLKRNGSTLVLDDDAELLNKEGYVLPVVEREGYEFKGWKVQGTNDLVDATAPLTNDVVLVAVLEQCKYTAYYFNTKEAYDAYIADGELVANTYVAVENIVYGGNVENENAPSVFGKTHVAWKGFYVEENITYTVNSFVGGDYEFLGNVYLYPEYTNDTFVVKYESGITADFGTNDYVEVVYEVLGIDQATLNAAPTHVDGKPFDKWVFNKGTVAEPNLVDITTDPEFRTAIANAVKGDVFVLTATFNENDYVVYRYNNEQIIDPIVAETGVTYDVTSTEIAAWVAGIETANPGYHVEWFIGSEAFVPFSWAEEADIANVVIEAKLVKNEATLVLKVWGIENSTAIGSINDVYSVELDVENGDAINVTLAGKNGYVFVYWTTEAWTTSTSSAPAQSTVINTNNEIFVAEDGATIVVYAYFYNYIIA